MHIGQHCDLLLSFMLNQRNCIVPFHSIIPVQWLSIDYVVKVGDHVHVVWAHRVLSRIGILGGGVIVERQLY